MGQRFEMTERTETGSIRSCEWEFCFVRKMLDATCIVAFLWAIWLIYDKHWPIYILLPAFIGLAIFPLWGGIANLCRFYRSELINHKLSAIGYVWLVVIALLLPSRMGLRLIGRKT